MHSLNQKIFILNTILQEKEENYADSFKGEIYLRINDFNRDALERLFLYKLNSAEEIREWINKLTSRIVMHEDDADVCEIIWDYMYCG